MTIQHRKSPIIGVICGPLGIIRTGIAYKFEGK
jgi:hypothetical protein